MRTVITTSILLLAALSPNVHADGVAGSKRPQVQLADGVAGSKRPQGTITA